MLHIINPKNVQVSWANFVVFLINSVAFILGVRTAQEIGTLQLINQTSLWFNDFYKVYQNDAKQTEQLEGWKMYVSPAEVPPGALDTLTEVANCIERKC